MCCGLDGLWPSVEAGILDFFRSLSETVCGPQWCLWGPPSVEGGLAAALVLEEGPECIPDGRLEGRGLHTQPHELQPRALQLGVVGPLGPSTRRLLCKL